MVVDRSVPGRNSVAPWLSRCKARPSYAAISEYLDTGYLQLMPEKGAELRTRVETILSYQSTGSSTG